MMDLPPYSGTKGYIYCVQSGKPSYFTTGPQIESSSVYRTEQRRCAPSYLNTTEDPSFET
jgi:hypothetical protein